MFLSLAIAEKNINKLSLSLAGSSIPIGKTDKKANILIKYDLYMFI